MDYSSLTVKKLQQLSKQQGLPTKGNKKELIQGLESLKTTAMELISASLPPGDMDAEYDSAPAPAVEAPVALAPIVIEAPITPAAPVPVAAEETIGNVPAAVVETAPAPTVVAPVAAPMVRVSMRTLRPRICTMCVGCHSHPVHIAGKLTRKPATAVVDDASIGDLADKLATVKIAPQQQLLQEENAPEKASVNPTKPRTTVTKTRAPLRAKPNQAVENEKTAEDAQQQAKPVKGKGKASSKPKLASVKGITAALDVENGKENLPSGIDEAKVTTERVGRRGRSVKPVAA